MGLRKREVTMVSIRISPFDPSIDLGPAFPYTMPLDTRKEIRRRLSAAGANPKFGRFRVEIDPVTHVRVCSEIQNHKTPAVASGT